MIPVCHHVSTLSLPETATRRRPSRRGRAGQGSAEGCVHRNSVENSDGSQMKLAQQEKYRKETVNGRRSLRSLSLAKARLSQGLVALHKCQDGTTLRESLVPEFLNVNLRTIWLGKTGKNRPFGFFLENSAQQRLNAHKN